MGPEIVTVQSSSTFRRKIVCGLSYPVISNLRMSSWAHVLAGKALSPNSYHGDMCGPLGRLLNAVPRNWNLPGLIHSPVVPSHQMLSWRCIPTVYGVFYHQPHAGEAALGSCTRQDCMILVSRHEDGRPPLLPYQNCCLLPDLTHSPAAPCLLLLLRRHHR